MYIEWITINHQHMVGRLKTLIYLHEIKITAAQFRNLVLPNLDGDYTADPEARAMINESAEEALIGGGFLRRNQRTGQLAVDDEDYEYDDDNNVPNPVFDFNLDAIAHLNNAPAGPSTVPPTSGEYSTLLFDFDLYFDLVSTSFFFFI
jgi:hypothetical protein